MEIIEEVAKAKAQRFVDEPSRQNAAWAFMQVAVRAFQFLAVHGQYGAFIARRIEEAECDRAYMAEQAIKDKAAFVERMRKARASKQAKKAAGSSTAR